ncbi:MAG: sigma-54-dependent Fis family transcriptional regulator [Myxococcales bacterium]|nr:sigma-54-dependent Fis family transcriptional regulator [Myxococcales bacterium]
MDRAERARTTVLVVEDDLEMRELLHEALSDEGYRVELASGGRAGIARVKEGGIDLVVTDVKMPDLDGLDALSEIRTVEPTPHVIVITAFGSIETAIKAVKLGAYDYITKPFDIDVLTLGVEKALNERGLRHEVARLRREVARPYRFENIIGKSQPMQDVFGLIRRLAASAANVLITGESGTGKELIARALHFNSPRAKRPFVAVNCAAIPDTLLESELFGYKRGAFTDARTDRAGMFVEADGGTLFLDEIGDLSPALQAKLLRVIQEREIRPLGAARSERIDVRVLSATNRDLEQRMKEGAFREDLYYRLNVIQVVLPPLRDRAEDILPLADHFLAEAAKRSGKRVAAFTASAFKVLAGHPWPGNVRELENVIERAVALAETAELGVDDLPPQVRERRNGDVLAGALARNLTLAELEREYIARVLQAEGGNKTRAAQRLGLDRKTLYRKLEEYERAPLAGDESTAQSPPSRATVNTPQSMPAAADPPGEPQAPARGEATVRIPRDAAPEDLDDDER